MGELVKRGCVSTSTDWRVDHSPKGCVLKGSAPAGQYSHAWCAKDLNNELFKLEVRECRVHEPLAL